MKKLLALALLLPNLAFGVAKIQTPDIANNAVTNAKMATMLNNTVKGNNAGSTGAPVDMTASQTKTILAIACADLTNGAASCSTDATNATNITSGALPAARMPALTGDITTSAGAVATTLATVNSNVGSFTSANITVNAKGLVTAAANGSGGGSTVVCASVTGSPGAITNGNPIIFPTDTVDPSSIYSTSTGLVTVPSGKTQCFMRWYLTGDATNTLSSCYKNSSKYHDAGNTDTTGSGWQNGSCFVAVTSGDTVSVRPNKTLTGNAGDNMDVCCM